MRKQSVTTSEYGTKRMLLVDNPQNERYRGAVVCYMYYGEEDGPALGFHLYYGASIDQVIEELEEISGRSGASWSIIPDQVLGCADEWIAPVRVARNERGEPIKGEWEKLEGAEWVRVQEQRPSSRTTGSS